MIILLSTLWFIRTVKAILFWLYLWQLKEYHIGRFVDHFRTAKGKSLILNPILISKYILLVIFLAFFLSSILEFLNILSIPVPSLLASVLFVAMGSAFLLFVSIYVADGVIDGVWKLFRKKLFIPVFTKKIIILTTVSLALTTLLLVLLFQFSQIVYVALRWDLFASLFFLAIGLLLFDLLTPVLISLVILVFQPLAVFGRKLTIQKARQKRAQFKNLTVIGITGSYGKTSTKEFLFAILQKKFRVVKTPEHLNSEVGVSQTILQDLCDDTEIFICEMGAYNKGGIKLLASIAKPSIGVLCGINQQHMATFGSQENIIQAKYELIESLPENGTAFFNSKNRYCVELYNKTNIKKVLYGQTASFRGEENILGAMAVAKELGMTDEEISGAVKGIDATFPGAKIQKGKDGLTVIDATYSANPDGVIAGLEYLNTFPGKKIIVMPCLIELGKASKEVHKRIGEKIAEVCDLAIITTEDRIEDIQEGVRRTEKAVPVLFLENPQEIVEKIKSTTNEGDVVLLEGRIPPSVSSGLLRS